MRLDAENLAGERGGELVFSHLSFSLSAGEGLIVTGPNGSGKSTLLRIICGLLAAADGHVRLRHEGEEIAIQQACHYLGHHNAMKPSLSVSENLRFWQSFMGDSALEIDEALEQVELPGVEHLPFGYLSTGQKRRVSIAKLLVCRRSLWIVDEPTSGLDKASEARFAALMAAHMDQGGMIIAATHIPLGLSGLKSLDMADFAQEAM